MPPVPLSSRTASRVLLPVLCLLLARPASPATSKTAPSPHPRDKQPPVLTLIEPAEGAIVTTPTIRVRGTVTDESPVTVRVEGHRVPVLAGAFTADVRLHRGRNRIEVEAQDAAGNHARVSRTVRFEDLSRIRALAPPGLLAAGLPALGHLAVAPDGAILVTAPRAGRIYRVPTDGSPPRVLADHLRHPLGIAVAGDGTLYVAERDADRILRIASDGTRSVVLERVDGPRGLTLGRPGELFLTARRWPRTGRDEDHDVHRGVVLRLDLATGSVRVVADGLIRPEGIVAATAGEEEILWVAAEREQGEGEAHGEALFRITLAGAVTPIPGPRLWRPRGLARDALGALWLTARRQLPTAGQRRGHDDAADDEDDAGARGVLFKVTPEGLWHRYATGLDEPAGLAFEGNGDLLVVEADRGRILRFRAPPAPQVVAPPPTNAPSVSLTGAAEPSALVVARGPAGMESILADTEGRFQVGVPLLADQSNPIEVFAVASAGAGLASAPAVLAAIQDGTPPTLTVEAPPPNALTNGSPLPVRGRVADANGPLHVFVNETEVAVDPAGAFGTPLPLLEGPNEVRVRAVDAAGNVSTETRTVVLDTTPPGIVITAPLENAIIPQTAVRVTGTVTDVHLPATVTVNGYEAPLSEGGFSAEIPFPISQTTITVRATDRAGNPASLTRTVVRDMTPPTLALVTGPADPTNSRTLPLTVTGTDNVTPADQLEFAFSLDSETAYSAYGASPSASFTVAQDGPHTLRAKAKDQAGNESPPLVVAIRVDTVPPAITLAAPAENFLTNQATATVSGTVADAGAITDVTVNGQAVTLTGTSFTQSVPLTEGPNTLTVTATDAAGNRGTAAVSGTLDTVPPVITFSAPAADAVLNTAPLPVTGTVSEAVATLTVNGIAATVGSGTFTVSIVPTRGVNTLTATATDQAGNAGTASLSFTYDDIPPLVRILTPVGGQFLSQTSLTVTGTVDDPTASVTVNGVSATVFAGLFTASGVVVGPGAVTLVAEARDPAGNLGTDQVVLTVDTTPPAITSLTVPAEVTAGTAVTLAVAAGDNLGLASLDLLVDGRLVASGSTSPVGVGFTIPPDKAVNDTLTVTARAVDVAGLATTQLAPMRVGAAAVGPGFLKGLVLDDAKGLPLAGATVTVQNAGTAPPDPQVTGPDGQYAFTLEPGTALVRVTKEGMTPAERKVPVRSDLLTAVPDARLTPRDPTQNVLGPAGGIAANQDNTLRLSVPAGALAEDVSVKVTPVSDQGLNARLPLGWSPVAVADLAPASLTLAAPGRLFLRLPDSPVPRFSPGSSITFARYDRIQQAWVALEPATVTNDGLALEATVGAGGQVAFLLPDPAPQAPPAAIAGEVLAGVAPAAIPDDATATGGVTPAVIPPGQMTVTGQVTITPTAPLPSGTVVQAVVSETYTLLSGEEITSPPFVQELVLYHSAFGYPLGVPNSALASLEASFPVTPSKTYTLKELAVGTVHLALQTPETGGQGTIIGPEGGTLTASDGTILTIPPGALARETVVALAPVTEADLRLAIPAGFQVLKAVSIDLTRATLSLSAEIAFAVPAGITGETQVLVAKILEVDGILKLQAVGVGQVSGTLLTSRGSVPGVTLPGIASGGTYVALRAATPIGFVAGTITDGSNAAKVGVVVASGTGLVDVSRSDGQYLLATAAGSATLTATDRATGQGTSQAVTIPSGTGITQPLRVQVIPPTVVGVTPAAGATGVPVNSQVALTFSQPIAKVSLTGSSLVLSGPTGPVETTITLSPLGTEATLYPAKALASQTTYSLVATQAIQDTHGVGLVEPFTSQFTTANAPPPPPPAGSITVSFPDEQGNVTVTATQGTAPPDYLVVVLNVSSGTVASATVGPNGALTASLFALLGDELLVMIQDAAGSQTVVSPGPYRSTDGQFVMTRSGGSLDTPEGISLTLAAAAVTQPVTLKLTALTLDQVAASIPPGLQFLGGLTLETQGTSFKTGAKVSLPLPSGVTIPTGAQPFLARMQMVGGVLTPVLVDTMRVVSGKLMTSSPPFPGVLNEGDYVALLPANPYPAVVTGSVLRDGTTPPQPIPGAIIKVDGTEVAATTDDQGKYALQLFPPDLTKPATFNLIAVDPATGAIRGASLTVPAWTVPNGGGSYTFDFALPAMGAGRDTTPPTIALTVDAPSLKGGRVAPGDIVTVTVKTTDDIGVRADTLILTRNGTSVPLALGAPGSPATVTFTPTTPWELITLVATAQDTSGNVGRAESTLQVAGGGGGGGETEVPPVLPDVPASALGFGAFPTPGEKAFDPASPLEVPFTQTLDPLSLTNAVSLGEVSSGTASVDIGVRLDPRNTSMMRITPRNRLRYGTCYRLEITQAVKGVNGLPIAKPFQSEFCTVDLTENVLALSNAKDVLVLGKYAIVLDRTEGLVTVDISDPTRLSKFGPNDVQKTPVFTGPFAANQGFTLAKDFTYVNANGESVTIPAAIVVVGWISLPQGGVRGLVRIFDATDPVHPRKLGSATLARCTTGVPMKVLVQGQYAVVASLLQGIVVVDMDTVLREREVEPLAPAAGGTDLTFAAVLPVAGAMGLNFEEDAANARCDPGKPKAVAGTWDANGQLKSPFALKPYGADVLVGDFQAGLFQVELANLPFLDGALISAGPIFRLDVLRNAKIPGQTPTDPGQITDLAAITTRDGIGLVDVKTGSPLTPTPIPVSQGIPFDVRADQEHSLLHVGTGQGGVEVFDISDPRQPQTLGNNAKVGNATGGLTLSGQHLLAATGQGLATVRIAADPVLEIYAESVDVARDRKNNPLPGIFLLKNDYTTDPPTPTMPTIHLRAKLRPGEEARHSLISHVLWKITLDYQITVPGTRAEVRARSRWVGKPFEDRTAQPDAQGNYPEECDGVELSPTPAHPHCGWPTDENKSILAGKVPVEGDTISIPWPFIRSEKFVGGGELQITATPVNAEGKALFPPTLANVEAGRQGLFFVTDGGQERAFDQAMVPGSNWPRIEGELTYPPNRYNKDRNGNTKNIYAEHGTTVNAMDRPFCVAVASYLRNPKHSLTTAEAVWRAVGHLDHTDAQGNKLADTKLFFQVLARKEVEVVPYAHFRKLDFNSILQFTGQPPQAAYPILNSTKDVPGQGQSAAIITDGGFGVMQLTNPPPAYSQIWHWRKNIDAAIFRVLDMHISAARMWLTGNGNTAKTSALNTYDPEDKLHTDSQYKMKMETYARYNGIGWHPNPTLQIPGEPVYDAQGNVTGWRYPFWRWDGQNGEWVRRVQNPRHAFRGGIRYAYEAEDIEAQLEQLPTPGDDCGG